MLVSFFSKPFVFSNVFQPQNFYQIASSSKIKQVGMQIASILLKELAILSTKIFFITSFLNDIKHRNVKFRCFILLFA
jgi:hypothetical protein